VPTTNEKSRRSKAMMLPRGDYEAVFGNFEEAVEAIAQAKNV
jgi:hypothetical protein